MCGRYYIESDDMAEQLARIAAEIERRQPDAAINMKLGEIYPTNTVPVISGGGAQLMKWGYSGFMGSIINARSETAFDKPMFRRSMLERRCLIPASGYYEWRRTGSGAKDKQKYALFSPEGPLFMAGIWREEQDAELPVFVILTRAATPCVAGIHDRMPVILTGDARSAWLRPDANAGIIMERALDELEYREA